ncbi:MAG TPA: hypothetical protein VLJ61_13800 [Pyrinomonadaceae bacterium]|nr:hypothetical protein [Pyrinomonadaceae bacterium]
MKNPSTNQTTPEQMKDAVTNIIHAGDDEAARALVGLVFALANVSDEAARQELALAVAERAYTRTDGFGNALLAFIRGGAQLHTESVH